MFVVFKKEAKDVAKALADHGFEAAALQGDMSQKARFLTLQRFRDGTVNVLVATDVAARGLDIPGVDLVVNYSLGTSIDMYIHRIGRYENPRCNLDTWCNLYAENNPSFWD